MDKGGTNYFVQATVFQFRKMGLPKIPYVPTSTTENSMNRTHDKVHHCTFAQETALELCNVLEFRPTVEEISRIAVTFVFPYLRW